MNRACAVVPFPHERRGSWPELPDCSEGTTLQNPEDTIICPQMMNRTEKCGTCGLCWNSEQRISFVQH
jgi:hypothetical protein